MLHQQGVMLGQFDTTRVIEPHRGRFIIHLLLMITLLREALSRIVTGRLTPASARIS